MSQSLSQNKWMIRDTHPDHPISKSGFILK